MKWVYLSWWWTVRGCTFWICYPCNTCVWLSSILPLNWPSYWYWYKTTIGPLEGFNIAQHLQHSVSLALCKQENTLDIALDTLPSLVFISQVKVCYQNHPNTSDFKGPTNTCGNGVEQSGHKCQRYHPSIGVGQFGAVIVGETIPVTVVGSKKQ